jgi:uncharacterized membrane protein
MSSLRERMFTRGAVAAGLVVLGVYAIALWFERYGIRSSTHGSDVTLYEMRAASIAHGSIPYRDFYFEYPPGALAPIMAAEPFSNYATAFKVVMAVIGAGALGFAAACLPRGYGGSWPLLAIAAAPAAVGSVFVNRFDLWPALLTVAALAFLVRGRPTAGFALLAAGAATKIFPAVALPAAAVWVWRTRGREALRRALLAFAVTGLLILLPFAILGPGGLRYSFTIQLTRHLQTESLGGALLLVAHRLGLYSPTIATGNPGSLDLFGRLPDVVGVLNIVLVLLLVVWGALLLARGRVDSDRMLAGTVAAVCVYVAFGKVLSPQYVLWLIPLVPLVRRQRMVATGLLLAILVLTKMEFDLHYGQIRSTGPVVWILLARDLLLVCLAVLLMSTTRANQPGSGVAKSIHGSGSTASRS